MTKKDKVKKKAKEYKGKESDMMKDEDVKEINQQLRDVSLWQKKK